MVLFSVYNANETQKILDAKEEEIDEKIRIAKEKIQQKDSASINVDWTIISIDYTNMKMDKDKAWLLFYVTVALMLGMLIMA